MPTSLEPQVAQLIAGLRGLQPRVETLSDAFRSKIAAFPVQPFHEYGADYWSLQSMGDALVRVKLFLERNFSFIETLGVLSLCRYTFELVVWLKHIERNEDFSLVYARQLMLQQQEFFSALHTHLLQEIELYRELGSKEKDALSAVMSRAPTFSAGQSSEAAGAQIAAAIQEASRLVDERLAQSFSIYAHEVVHYGYDFQAHRLQSQAIPQALQAEQDCKNSLTLFDAKWMTKLNAVRPKSWKWKERADFVQMSHEYEFIYSYTSRLLHATPASLTTDQKSLDISEILIFIRYISMQFHWIVRRADYILNGRPGS